MAGENKAGTRPKISEIMVGFKVTDEDLAICSKALHTQSYEGKKLFEALPAELKEKVAGFYRYLRQTYGIHPNKLDEHGKMTYYERVSCEEAWKRALKDREMFPNLVEPAE